MPILEIKFGMHGNRLMHYKTIIIIYSIIWRNILKYQVVVSAKHRTIFANPWFSQFIGSGGTLGSFKSNPQPVAGGLCLSHTLRHCSCHFGWGCLEFSSDDVNAKKLSWIVGFFVCMSWFFAWNVWLCLKKTLQALRRDGEGEPGFLHVAGTILSDLLVFRVFFVKMMIFRSIYVRFEELGVV